MVNYASNELVSSSEFAKKFGSYLSLVKSNTVEKLAILKNNKIEAVLVSKDEYEAMSEALKRYEAEEFLKSVNKGLNDIKNNKTKPIDTLWDQLDD